MSRDSPDRASYARDIGRRTAASVAFEVYNDRSIRCSAVAQAMLDRVLSTTSVGERQPGSSDHVGVGPRRRNADQQ
jgi:hypothetical protein